MFVRWQARKRINRLHRGSLIRWSALLVESVLVDGRWRQRHVAFLGSIEDGELKDVRARGRFLVESAERLDTMPIAPQDRQRIEVALTKKVRRVSPKQHEKSRQAFEATRRILGKI
jgi:hypothetical protein